MREMTYLYPARSITVCIFCWVAFVFSGCQTARVPEKIETISIPQSNVGYIVYDTESKKVVVEQNADQRFIPASVGKIPSVLAALSILGPNYRFKTVLATDGVRRGSILKGNLYLVGGGDPFLTLADIMVLVQRLKDKGISKVEGSFYFDESFFVSRPAIDLDIDQDSSFNPGVSALSSEFNRYYLNRKKLPVKQPGLFTANLFRQMAAFEGIRLELPENGSLPKRSTSLIEYESPALVQLAGGILEYSNNLMAELVQLAAARKLVGKALSQEDAAAEIAAWYRKNIQGVSWDGFDYKRGSGDANPVMTPRQILAILKWGSEKRFLDRSLMSLLPISGWKGSLLERMSGPSTSLRVWAKTGTMSFGTSLAGYFYSQSGKKYIFALLCTDLAMRQLYEAVHRRYWNTIAQNVALDSSGDFSGISPADTSAQGKQWATDSRNLMDGLLRKWINTL